jgi:hypothetical protein
MRLFEEGKRIATFSRTANGKRSGGFRPPNQHGGWKPPLRAIALNLGNG